jgi:hypothetical protein
LGKKHIGKTTPPPPPQQIYNTTQKTKKMRNTDPNKNKNEIKPGAREE